ncbi:MAG: hypothetical protein K2X66_17050 [Cyanobacteria bacterium]|nr:hypothetical protein [Cyanobacteriota bacterium]
MARSVSLQLSLFMVNTLFLLSSVWTGAWADLICPDPNFPKNCFERPTVQRENNSPPPQRDNNSTPPQKFIPNSIVQEIQRAFTVGNTPRGINAPPAVMAPAFVDEAPDFSEDYPMCETDGKNALCP